MANKINITAISEEETDTVYTLNARVDGETERAQVWKWKGLTREALYNAAVRQLRDRHASRQHGQIT